MEPVYNLPWAAQEVKLLTSVMLAALVEVVEPHYLHVVAQVEQVHRQ
jgi:hypothetical protein